VSVLHVTENTEFMAFGLCNGKNNKLFNHIKSDWKFW